MKKRDIFWVFSLVIVGASLLLTNSCKKEVIQIPVLTTSAVSAITSSSAASGGNITASGGAAITARGVCWSTIQNPTISDSKTSDGTGTGVFTSSISGLSPGATYYARAYATNVAGTGYGSQVTITILAVLPSISTTAASAITGTSTNTGGNITSDGGGAITARGVCWSTVQNPTVADNKTTDGTGTGVFTSSISTFTPATTYYLRAYATNSAGTIYGNQITILTLAVMPTVTTTDASSITSSSASSGGNVTNDGGAAVTARGVCWSTTTGPTIVDSKTVNDTGTGVFTSAMSSLAPGTTYYIKAYATNSVGTAYGNQVTATTPAILSTVSTTSISSVTESSLTCNGNITSDGGAAVTSRGVCWSTNPTPTTADSKTLNGMGTGTFSATISGLSPGTTYYFRAYAINSVGISYGSQLTQATLSILPVITTTAPTAVTSSSASSGGNITNDGGATVTTRGVCWNTTGTPTTANQKTSDGTGTGAFTSSMTSLAPATTYYIRAYATNSIGTAYGSQVQITTFATIPVISTTDATALTTTTATTGGNVTSDGGAAVTSRGVCWSTSQNPTTADSKTINGMNTGSFVSSLTGLSPATTYYVRAYAANSIGTAYGTQISFTTVALLPTLTTTAISAVTTTTASSGGNISSDGGATITARGVCWSTSQNPTIANDKTTNGTGTGSYTSSITGLYSSTTYYVRAYATNSAGTAYGPQLTLTTIASVPSLTTTEISSITTTTATGGGNILSDGGSPVTAKGVCWSTTENPAIANSKTSDGTGTGIFSSSITGLLPVTTYYVRAYATNAYGTAYGNQVTMTTAATLPTLTTTSLSAITSTTATSGGNITSDGGATITAKGVCWSTTGTPTIANQKTSDGTGSGVFTSALTSLTPNTTYYVRAYATSSAGTAYGNQLTIHTLATLPEVTTTALSSITSTSASSGGNVTSDGGATVTARGVCWNTAASPTIANSKTTDGVGTGIFTSSISSLSAGTTYYVRAYATNSIGTSYGQQISFITSYITVVGTSGNIQHIDASGNFVFRLNSLVNKNVFFVFSNINTSTSKTLPAISGSVASVQMAKEPITAKQSEFVVSGKPSISDFNNNPWKYTTTGLTKSQYQQYLATKPENYIVGTTEALFDETGPARMSTVRKVITAHGKNLYVWVDDLCWGPTSTKKHYITQDMVDNLASKFLNSGTNDDIYEWVTNICGAPWGPSMFSNLIPSTDDIHIWLTDIDGDNSDNGGVVGYFWGRNNFLKTSQPSSNEKVMFVIDAVMFATPTPSGGTWEMTDYWPQKVISALAHEFLHMIYFYQKTVLQNVADANSAVNEMLAQCVEDLVANKIQTNGPRGVGYGIATAGLGGNTAGRLPLYNSSNDYTLLDWSSSSSETYINYSKTYALGAYLMRNYGGVYLVKSMVQNGSTGVNCIVNAVNANSGVGITFENILKNFGAANLLSDRTTLTSGYIYNTNTWFTSSINGIDYQLGSINLYNYSPNPYIYSTLPTTQKAGSNVYYLSGSNLTGTKEWTITGLNSDIKLTVIIK